MKTRFNKHLSKAWFWTARGNGGCHSEVRQFLGKWSNIIPRSTLVRRGNS